MSAARPGPAERGARDAVVVGGGISGLIAAHRLHRGGVDVTLLEAGQEPGGWVGTETIDGFLVERGPHTVRGPGRELRGLLEELGLAGEVCAFPSSEATRFLAIEGRAVPAPGGIRSLLSNPLLTPAGRVRLLLEPFVPARPEGDESVAAFFRRRLGREGARLADPAVSALHAGDPERLSLRSAFPELHRHETGSGSLLVGALRGAGRRLGSGAPSSRFVSLRSGWGRLVASLRGTLGERVRTGAAVTSLARENGAWRVAFGEEGETLRAGAVLLAVPSHRAVPLLEPLDPEAGKLLAGIEWAGVVALCLDYPGTAFPSVPEGFRIVAPRREGVRMLGCLFVSSLLPEHAPPGRVSLRVLAGGAHDPGAVEEGEESLVRSLSADVAALLGAREAPRVLRLLRHPDSIPQYVVGHGERLAAIEGRLRALPGLFLTGASYRGFTLPECAAGAEICAASVQDYLAERGFPVPP